MLTILILAKQFWSHFSRLIVHFIYNKWLQFLYIHRMRNASLCQNVALWWDKAMADKLSHHKQNTDTESNLTTMQVTVNVTR